MSMMCYVHLFMSNKGVKIREPTIAGQTSLYHANKSDSVDAVRKLSEIYYSLKVRPW